MRIIELLISLTIGLMIGAGMVMALGVRSPSQNAGDWLAFSGALIGVVATILGTIWLERYRTASQEKRERRNLNDFLKVMEGKLMAIKGERGTAPIADARSAWVAAEEEVLKAFDKFNYARHFVPRQDVNSWHAIEALQASIVVDRPMLETEARVLREAGDSEAVFEINIDKVGRASDRILAYLRSAQEEVSRGL